MPKTHSCFLCGMQFPDTNRNCPKCDYGRYDQNHSKRLSADIAHNLQTVNQATQQFYDLLAQAKREKYGELRIVVGGGLINKEIGRLLEAEQWKNQFKSFDYDKGNNGAYLIKLQLESI